MIIEHPIVPIEQIAANINLDQLRPIFPLELMTVHARTDTTLGADATTVATAQGIRVQDDPEPDRNLLRRSDHWPFLQAGIPAVISCLATNQAAAARKYTANGIVLAITGHKMMWPN